MTDTSHLVALHTRLHNEKARLAVAKTKKERDLRTVWIVQIEKEIADEMKFLGMDNSPVEEISDDDLFAELDKAGF